MMTITTVQILTYDGMIILSVGKFIGMNMRNSMLSLSR